MKSNLLRDLLINLPNDPRDNALVGRIRRVFIGQNHGSVELAVSIPIEMFLISGEVRQTRFIRADLPAIETVDDR